MVPGGGHRNAKRQTNANPIMLTRGLARCQGEANVGNAAYCKCACCAGVHLRAVSQHGNAFFRRLPISGDDRGLEGGLPGGGCRLAAVVWLCADRWLQLRQWDQVPGGECLPALFSLHVCGDFTEEDSNGLPWQLKSHRAISIRPATFARRSSRR